ncbi:MAG: type II toxin-antitoxin system ParD family antitoxin [Cyanobacteria bacterium P01_F01_bin.143]
MTIKLKPEQEKFIEEQVASGKYNSPEELVDKMFQVFGNLQSEYDEWVKETRRKMEEGIESLDKGEGVDGEIVFKKLSQARKNKS